MKKVFVLFYSLLCYLLGLASVGYYMAFFIGMYVPKSINHGETTSTGYAILANSFLILIFTFPHTAMARPSIKGLMRRYVPFAMERSTYILVSSFTLFVLCIFWQPLPHAVYDFRSTPLEPVFWSLYAIGWLITLFSTFLIDHFDLFGLKQAWHYGSLEKTFRYRFVTPLLYKLVRHPIYLGWLMVHWFTPYLSVGQLILAFSITLYILVAIEYEEKDLERAFGHAYKQYKLKTPKLIPLSINRRRRDRNQDFIFF